MSPEIAAGVAAKSDPAASSLAAFTGVALPFGRAHQVTLGGWREVASRDGREASGSGLFAALTLRGRSARAITGAQVGMSEAPGVASRVLAGAFGSVNSKVLDGHAELGLDAELGSTWRETPRAIVEAGRVDAVTTHIFGTLLGGRLVTDTGAQVRQLRLGEPMGESALASQVLLWGGADVALWTNFSHEAAGETLDDELLHPASFSDSVVIGYRHYELWAESDARFAARLSLADRGSIDELSLTARKAVARGRVAFEARGGGGRDWQRNLLLARAGIALWLATSVRSRFSLTLDFAKESAHALTGDRRSGWMTYHVDL